MKLLFLVQNFRQGWGGAPESTRLMARELHGHGVTSDVFDRGRLHRRIETLASLPNGSGGEAEAPRVEDYDAVLLIGPWQDVRPVRTILKAMPRSQPLFYLPRGGLARVEFAGTKLLKKLPYWLFVERAFMKRATGIVYSSEAERRETIRPARRLAAEHVVADIVAREAGAEAGPPGGPVTLRFLGEISPRKGIRELVEAFLARPGRSDGGNGARLTIAGGVRPGCEAYLERIVARCRADGGAEMIDFPGPIPHDRRARFYAETDIVLIPSRFESFGLTLFEGLGHGCSVLASPFVGALEYLPGHAQVTVAAGLGADALGAAIDRSLDALDRAGRGEVRQWAADAIDAMNRRAVGQWFELLGRSGGR